MIRRYVRYMLDRRFVLGMLFLLGVEVCCEECFVLIKYISSKFWLSREFNDRVSRALNFREGQTSVPPSRETGFSNFF